MTRIGANKEIAVRGRDEIAVMFQPRKYTDTELEQFHNKIQKFWDKPREITHEISSGTAQKFRHEDLHVAFGAARRVEHGVNEDKTPRYKYLYNPERYEVFNNLWKQYEDWRRKQDWIREKNTPALDKMAQEGETTF